MAGAPRPETAIGELQEQFVASLSHELRTPLATLLLWEKVLRDDPPDPELRGRALAAIHDSAVALARLVDNLLDFARASGGRIGVDRRALSLPGLLSEAVADASPAAAAHAITIATSCDPDLPEVLADPVRLRQALDNLISNALKFSHPGGRVCLTARVAGDRVAVCVRDEGEGIAHDDLSRLFLPFQPLDQTLTRAHGGLGLGLMLARHLVELQGGELSGSSEGPGRGAAFTIALPAAPGPPASDPAEPTAGRTPLVGLRLLLVDDEARVREALKVLLERAGAEVRCAATAAEALAELAARRPDVLISDAVMPGEDGPGLVRRLRQEGGPSHDVPAVALTAYGQGSARDRLLGAGFDALCTKPIDYDQLTEIIAHVARRRVSSTEE